MGTERNRPSGSLYGSLRVTTRVVVVPTSPYTTVVLTSANMGAMLYVHGTGNLIWGGSNVAVNTGATLYPAMSYEWAPVEDGYTFYCIAESVPCIFSLNEYGVP